MPYQESPHFDTPGKTDELWRYMRIDKFMAMLNDGALYFPKITSFKDNYEGKLPFFTRQIVQKENLFNEDNTPVKRDDAFYKHKNLFEDTHKKYADDVYKESGFVIHHLHSFETLLEDFSNHLMFCSSWFLKPIESHSMWTEYGEKIPTSIAIQTTVVDLIDSLYVDDNEFHIHIGKVEYIDYKTGYIEAYQDFSDEHLTDHDTVFKLFYAPVMHKRNLFEDEHEVRMSPNVNEYFYNPLIKLIKYYGLDRNRVYFSDI